MSIKDLFDGIGSAFNGLYTSENGLFFFILFVVAVISIIGIIKAIRKWKGEIMIDEIGKVDE